MLPVFVMNLKRRRDRLDRFKAFNGELNMEFHVVEAIEGSEVDCQTLLQSGLIDESFRDYSRGDIGCAFSHRALWMKSLEMDQSILILEDDAVLRSDFVERLLRVIEELPDHWDVVLLGYNFDSVLDIALVPGVDYFGEFAGSLETAEQLRQFQNERSPTQVFKLNHAFGTMAYLVSPTGAKRMLQLCFPMTETTFPIRALRRIMNPKSVDGFLNGCYSKMNAYCLLPPLAVSPNLIADSDTK